MLDSIKKEGLETLKITKTKIMGKTGNPADLVTLAINGKTLKYNLDYKDPDFRSGGTAGIYRGSYGDEKVVIRRISISTCEFSYGSPQALHNIMIKLKKINSPYLLMPKFDFIEKHKSNNLYYCQVLDCMDKNLEEYCTSGEAKKLSHLKIYQIAHQIAQGVAALHINSYVHRDLAPRNIMLNQNLNVVIIDFDEISASDKHAYEINGSRLMIAPEQQLKQDLLYTPQTDIYVLGIIFWLLAVRPSTFKVYADTLDLKPANDFSPEFAKLIQACRKDDPKDRPTAQELCAQLQKLQAPITKTLEASSEYISSSSTISSGVLPKLILGACAAGAAALGFFAYRHYSRLPISTPSTSSIADRIKSAVIGI